MADRMRIDNLLNPSPDPHLYSPANQTLDGGSGGGTGHGHGSLHIGASVNIPVAAHQGQSQDSSSSALGSSAAGEKVEHQNENDEHPHAEGGGQHGLGETNVKRPATVSSDTDQKRIKTTGDGATMVAVGSTTSNTNGGTKLNAEEPDPADFKDTQDTKRYNQPQLQKGFAKKFPNSTYSDTKKAIWQRYHRLAEGQGTRVSGTRVDRGKEKNSIYWMSHFDNVSFDDIRDVLEEKGWKLEKGTVENYFREAKKKLKDDPLESESWISAHRARQLEMPRRGSV
ncbi:hypothetical protein K491DRAFT_740011 [Lophiostoma macrostomum CBS 122681]|uniref:Uncharacterized protein n=1 Tax=Lophiostoma macrostomum CBS 122681 TaxID=1314788 RepID=A0A6A6TDK6_9PLEO|nr:hypothetical protein K491DRAFT_740011 [Lophiostoma macrostomum CBS 122681]